MQNNKPRPRSAGGFVPTRNAGAVTIQPPTSLPLGAHPAPEAPTLLAPACPGGLSMGNTPLSVLGDQHGSEHR